MRIGVVGRRTDGLGHRGGVRAPGVDVTVVEADDERAERSRAAIEKSLDRAVRGGKLEQADREAALDRLAFTTSLDDLEGADAAIEAIVEDEQRQARALQAARRDPARREFLASNTSSVPIMKLGAGTSSPTACSACTSSTRCRCCRWSRS